MKENRRKYGRILFVGVVVALFPMLLRYRAAASPGNDLENKREETSDTGYDWILEPEPEDVEIQNMVDITQYYKNWENFIALKGMEKEQEATYMVSYLAEHLRLLLYNEGRQYLIENTGDPLISAYGIRIGDTWEEALKAISSYSVVLPVETASDDQMELYIWDKQGIDSQYLTAVQVELDAKKRVKRWIVLNWPQGEDVFLYHDSLEAASEAGIQELQDWQIAYINLLCEHYDCAGADLMYVNDDDIPELVIVGPYWAAGNLIVTYDDASGEIKSFIGGNYGTSYIERQNLLKDTGGHMDAYYDKIYEIRDGEFQLVGYGDYGAENNANVQFDFDGMPVYNYYWNGEEISEQEYLECLNACFDLNLERNPECKYRDELAAEIIYQGVEKE